MPVRLRNQHEYPPGGYVFSDPHTGQRFDTPNVDLNFIVKQIQEHRRANPKIYPESDATKFDPAAITQEVIIQICADKPQACEDSDHPGRAYPYVPPEPPKPPVPVHREQGLECPRCHGQNFELQFCVTCGGRRVTGKKCLGCGFVL